MPSPVLTIKKDAGEVKIAFIIPQKEIM